MKKQIILRLSVFVVIFLFSSVKAEEKSEVINLFNGENIDNWIQKKPGGCRKVDIHLCL